MKQPGGNWVVNMQQDHLYHHVFRKQHPSDYFTVTLLGHALEGKEGDECVCCYTPDGQFGGAGVWPADLECRWVDDEEVEAFLEMV